MINIAICRPFFVFDNARISEHNAMTRHVAIHITVWGYQHIVTDGNLSDNRRIDTYPYAVANSGYALAAATVFLADGYPFVDITVFANDRIRIDSDATHMSQIEARTNVAFTINVNKVSILQFFKAPTVVLKK